MIILFLGKLSETEKNAFQARLKKKLARIVKNEPATFLFTELRDVERYALPVCKDYQKEHPACRLVFVPAFRDEEYLKTHFSLDTFDEILVPDGIDGVSEDQAVATRNAWMVKKATHVFGVKPSLFFFKREYGKLLNEKRP